MPENTLSGSSTLQVSAFCFNVLMNCLLEKLEQTHPGILNKKVSQVYGFAGYDENQVSLKSELQKLTDSFINGKYLYDKKRELSSGKPFIKITKSYNYLLFEYLGYEDIYSFIETKILDVNEKQKQLDLLNRNEKEQNHYYVSYHFGEYKEIVKAQVTVKDNWKRIEYNYIYPQEDGSFKDFIYFGDIKKRADALHISTRTFLDGKMVPSGENILYIGYGDPAKSKYLLGVFSAFDINNKIIAAKFIHEKCRTLEEMQSRSLEKKTPGYIAQELRNQRLEIDNHIPNDKLEISSKSPFYLTYEKIVGDYHFQFDSEQSKVTELKIKIDPDTFKITSSIPGILISSDDIQLINNASILNLRLKLSGLSPFLQIEIFIKTYYLNDMTNKAKGKFSGIDFENRLVAGDCDINFKPVSNSV